MRLLTDFRLDQGWNMLASEQFHPSLGVLFKHALISGVLARLSLRFITTDAFDILSVVYVPAFLRKQMQRHIDT
jgi:hypothetical protein